jgi:2-keto-4-pentenoate hydratase/2-oxohepta-3-ene-1,7-dioic acid hydratase in catechol pathway
MADEAGYPGDLYALIVAGSERLAAAHQQLLGGRTIDLDKVQLLPPLPAPGKIICVGLNYADHTKESPYEQPNYPTLFSRFASGLIGHGAPMVKPRISDQLDYEAELAVIIGLGGRHIPHAKALEHVAGYSIFNDGSLRDYQFKSPQWTVGKNFDATGPFGPVFVTADELPAGGKGLKIEARVNGKTVQSANTSEMIFDVQTLISTISEAISFEPGDVIMTGTPAGVAFGRKPPVYMKAGDVCEIEIENIGILRNEVVNEKA